MLDFCFRGEVFHPNNTVLPIYKTAKTFPREEIFGLTFQMRRRGLYEGHCFVTIYSGSWLLASQVAPKALTCIFQGSVEESRYYLILAKDLGYAETTDLRGHLEEISKMLAAYIKAIAS